MKTQKLFILFALLIPLLACAILPTGNKNPAESTVKIAADQGWQDTEVALQAGEQVRIEYVSGQAQDQETPLIDGTGTDFVCGHAGCCEPLPDARRSALIGRVGRLDDGIFYVGNGLELTAKTTGNLFLRINDCNSGLYDNSGAFQVLVTRVEQEQ
jgi:hypothetical protein